MISLLFWEAYFFNQKNRMEKELTKEEKQSLEEQAIETLLQYGARFSVPLKIQSKQVSKKVQWWNKHFPKLAITVRDKRIPKVWNVKKETITDLLAGEKEVYMRYFHIKPLYLGTIDMIRKLELEMNYSEDDIQNNPAIESNKLFKYTELMAKIVAVATLNVSEIADPLSGKVEELQKFFLTHLTSGRLQRLCMIIDQLRNKAGFTNSIRLILQVETTTTPKASRVE